MSKVKARIWITLRISVNILIYLLRWALCFAGMACRLFLIFLGCMFLLVLAF